MQQLHEKRPNFSLLYTIYIYMYVKRLCIHIIINSIIKIYLYI